MPRQTPYSVGRRWRFKSQNIWRGFPADFFFVVTGPGRSPAHKVCRIEIAGHGPEHTPGKCGHCCHHGIEQNYSHAHLKKYATLVEDD